MDNSLLNSNKLNENQLNSLHFLFNYIIPESKSLAIPGAAILLDTEEIFSDQFKNLIDKSLFIIECLIKNKSEIILNSKDDNISIELIDEFKSKNIRIFNELSFIIISYYYTNTNVLKSIKVKSIPPFPDGNFVEEGDLYLLEKVFIKKEFFRKININK